jgi:undecaprenyl-diphosphooligosaccharide--protein glycosyltransferase
MLLKRFLIPFILIAIPIFLGLQARYQAIPFWKEHQKEFYVEGRPIFTAYDSYLFARYGEDYKLGIFHPRGEDKLRFVPDYRKYPDVIPFYSWFFAELSSLFNKPIENLSFWLIPILAVLFTIPLALMLFLENLPFAALGGAVIGSVSLIYAIRTSINRLDTDSIILFSLFAIPFAVYLFEKLKTLREKYFALLLLAIFSNLFYWGYLHPGLNFVLWLFTVGFLSYPLVVNILKEKNFHVLNKNFLLQIGLITLVFNPFFVIHGFLAFLGRLHKYIFAFGKPIEDGFPNVQISISELQKLNIDALAIQTVGNKFLLIFGFIGILFFAIFRFRLFLLFAPTFLMGLIAFKGASRFGMFLAPMLGIGIGFVLDYLWKLVKDKFSQKVEVIFTSVLLVSFASVLAYANKLSFKFKPSPIMNADIASAFIELGRQTPADAWIFTWWDYGYAIQYYARRATFHDGGSQYTPKTYFVALAFTSPNPSVGYNVTKTLEVCGAKCIDNLLKEGKKPEQIKELFIKGKLLKEKQNQNPVYWVFTRDLIGKFYWISYFGNWNFKTLKGKHTPIFTTICEPINNLYECYTGRLLFIFNPQEMLIYLQRKYAAPVKYFARRTPQKLEIQENKRYPTGYSLETIYTYKPNNYAWYLTDNFGFLTNFNQLYILRNHAPEYTKYFKKIKEKFPDYVFYKLR